MRNLIYCFNTEWVMRCFIAEKRERDEGIKVIEECRK
jgi:hypothetical protein